MLLHDDVRRREENCQRGDDGEQRENEETDAIDDHGGELPVGDQIVLVFFLLQFGCDEAQFTYDRLQVSLSLSNTSQNRNIQI